MAEISLTKSDYIKHVLWYLLLWLKLTKLQIRMCSLADCLLRPRRQVVAWLSRDMFDLTLSRVYVFWSRAKPFSNCRSVLFPKNYRLENILYFVYLATGRARIYGPVAWNTIRALFSMIKIIASLSVLQQGSLRQIWGITIGIIGCGEI